jgi:hypothetical protein
MLAAPTLTQARPEKATHPCSQNLLFEPHHRRSISQKGQKPLGQRVTWRLEELKSLKGGVWEWLRNEMQKFTQFGKGIYIYAKCIKKNHKNHLTPVKAFVASSP